ncbi:MAG: DUF3784 domain-containing protein [Tyzzerella sp.]|nr:DUF3784 domain-containing protein [Tyzzerella sp.]
MDIIVSILIFIIAIIAFVISVRSYQEKGFLFNNAYLYASKEERETMDKKPHYRQSAIVFFMIGIIFLLNAINVFLKKDWVFYLVLLVSVITIFYAIVSSIKSEIKK